MGELTDKINFLAKKEKLEGLTEEEKSLQKELRKQYIENFRNNFSNQLDNTYIVDDSGNKIKLQKKQ